MTILIDLAVRSSIVLAAGLLAREVLLRRRSPALRHLVLAACVLAAPAVAPLGGVLPSIFVAIPAARVAAPPAASEVVVSGAAVSKPEPQPTTVAAGSVTSRLRAAGLALWAAGSAAGFAWLLFGCLRLARLTRGARPVTSGPWIDAQADLPAAARLPVLAVADSRVLATWGSRRPVLLVAEASLEWPAERIRCVLAHEHAHVARQDWLVHLAASGVRAALWWNPLAWLACRALREDAERACDDAVLYAGADAPGYAAHLVAIARDYQRSAPAAATAMSMARPSTLHRRIVAMLNPRLDRARPTRGAALGIVLAIFAAIVVPSAVVRTQGQTQRLEGVVYDPSGAVVPGVEMTLTSEQTTLATTSDSAGRFGFDTIAPGKYTLQISLAGFRGVKEEITLAVDRDWNRAITLQLGTLRETISIQAERRRVAVPTAPNGPTPVRVGGNIRAPRKIHSVNPTYPESMMREGREAVVALEARIDADGNVTSTRVVSTQVHPDFAAAAIAAMEQWRFEPTLLNGKPVEVLVDVSMSFSLK
jgi:TonB family protein